MALPREGYHRASDVACHAYLGYGESPAIHRVVRAACDPDGKQFLMGLVERAEQCLRYLLDAHGEHSGLYGTYDFILASQFR